MRNFDFNLNIVWFQLKVGWAATQITHLALLNDLTEDVQERTFLNSLRYLSTILSNLMVYLTTFALFKSTNSKTFGDYVKSNFNYTNLVKTLKYPSSISKLKHSEDPDIHFSSDDIYVFQKLSLSIVGLGVFINVLFYWGIRNSDIISNQNHPAESS